MKVEKIYQPTPKPVFVPYDIVLHIETENDQHALRGHLQFSSEGSSITAAAIRRAMNGE